MLVVSLRGANEGGGVGAALSESNHISVEMFGTKMMEILAIEGNAWEIRLSPSGVE